MGATVEGAFVIIDKASSVLEKIEKRAQATDSAMEKLGRRLDEVGSPQRLRKLDNAGRSIDNVGRAARVNEKHLSAFEQHMRNAGAGAHNLKAKLALLGGAFYGLTKVMLPAKFVGVGIAIGVLIQAVSALSAGVVALIPKLTDLVGVMGAAPAAVAGLGLAAITAKVAFSGLGKALGGNKDALKALTPQAREFVSTLKGFKPVTKELRESAQKGLFPGLTGALDQLRKGVPMAKRLMGDMGRALGGEARNWAGFLTTKGMLGDLEALGGQGIQIIRRLSSAMRYLFRAVVDVGIAAKPFTEWLTKMLVGWARHAALVARAGRETGKLGDYFDRVRSSMTTLGHILANVWVTFRNIGKAARPLGDDLYRSMEKATERWKEWTGSLRGQNWLRNWFMESRQPIHEIVGLFADLGKAIAGFKLTGLTETTRSLREMVPALKDMFESLATSGGPGLAAVLTEVAKILAELASPVGVFTMFLETLARFLKLVNDLIDAIPQFGSLLSAGILIGGLAKLRTTVMGVAQAFQVWATSATAAATATRGAAAMNATGAMAGMLPGAAAGFGATRLGQGLTGMRGAYAAARAPALMNQSGMMQGMMAGGGAGRLGAGWAAAKAGGAGMAGMAGAGLKAAGKFLWPLALIGGGLNLFSQGTGGYGVMGGVRNFAAGASFGLIPGTAATDEKALTKAQAAMQKQLAGISGPQAQLSYLYGARRRVQDVGGINDKTRKASLDMIQLEIDQRKELVKQLAIERGILSRTKGQQTGKNIQQAYEINKRKHGEAYAAQQLAKDVTSEAFAPGRKFPGARQIGQAGLSVLAQASKDNPKIKGVYRDLQSDLRRKFDAMGHKVSITNSTILSATAKDWPRIAKNMTTPVARAKAKITGDLTAIQNAAITSLTQMGIGRKEARDLVTGVAQAGSRKSDVASVTDIANQAMGNQNAANAGSPLVAGQGPFGATGMRIPGSGRRDTVPLTLGMAAPGELIVNRHTESRVDRKLRLFGTTLGREVAGEGTPHSAPVRERYATGGRAASQQAASLGGLGDVHTIVQLGRALQRMGYAVSENPAFGGVHPVHVPNSWHYKGLALDVNADSMPGGEAANLDRLYARLKRLAGVVELIWRAPNHYDHLHVAMSGQGAATGIMGGAGGAVAAPAPQLKNRLRVPAAAPGVAGMVQHIGALAYEKGLRRQVNKKLREQYGDTGANFAAGGGSFVSTAYGPPWGGIEGTGITATGIKLANAPTGRPGPYIIAVDPSVIPLHSKVKVWPNPFNYRGRFAAEDTGGAIKGNRIDFLDMIGRAHQNAWGRRNVSVNEKGGRLPDWGGWFGGGGAFTARRPTMIGVGERGAEHVQVTPAGRSRRGVRDLSVTIQNVHWAKDGDLKDSVKRELAAALSELQGHIDTVGFEDDSAVLA